MSTPNPYLDAVVIPESNLRSADLSTAVIPETDPVCAGWLSGTPSQQSPQIRRAGLSTEYPQLSNPSRCTTRPEQSTEQNKRDSSESTIILNTRRRNRFSQQERFKSAASGISLVLAFIIIILVNGSSALAQSRADDYVRTTYGKYSFVYCPEDSAFIEPLWQSLRNTIPVVENQLLLQLSDSVSFVITPTEREWHRVTAGSPLWANGIAYPARGVAVLKSPSFGLKYGSPLPVTALHEYVHLLVESGAEDAEIPRWLDEGLAQLLANQYDYRDTDLLSRAVVSNRLHRLWEIQYLMGMNDADARLAYAQSLIAVEWLRDEYGMSGLSNLVHELRNGKRFEEVFPALYGMPFGEFESRVQQKLHDTYSTAFYMNTEFWVPILFVVLVFFAGFARYRHRRKTVQTWEAETIGNRGNTDSSTKPPPYTINYTIVRNRPTDSESPPRRPSPGARNDNDDPPYDKPLPGN